MEEAGCSARTINTPHALCCPTSAGPRRLPQNQAYCCKSWRAGPRGCRVPARSRRSRHSSRRGYTARPSGSSRRAASGLCLRQPTCRGRQARAAVGQPPLSASSRSNQARACGLRQGRARGTAARPSSRAASHASRPAACSPGRARHSYQAAPCCCRAACWAAALAVLVAAEGLHGTCSSSSRGGGGAASSRLDR